MTNKSDFWVIEAQVTKVFKVSFEEEVTQEEAAKAFLCYAEYDVLDENELERTKIFSMSMTL